MRGQVSGRGWWLGFVFLLGMGIGRLVFPWLAPDGFQEIEIPKSDVDWADCVIDFNFEKTVLGRLTERGEAVHGMKCGEIQDFDDMSIRCNCVD